MPSPCRLGDFVSSYLPQPRQNPDNDRLLSLVRRAAAGERAVFAEFRQALSPGMRDTLAATLPAPDAAAVASAVLVEAWLLARFHIAPGTDVSTWIATIARRRAAERSHRADRRAGSGTATGAGHNGHWQAATEACRDRSIESVLTALAGPAGRL